MKQFNRINDSLDRLDKNLDICIGNLDRTRKELDQKSLDGLDRENFYATVMLVVTLVTVGIYLGVM